jgi:hypothetical protein
MRLVATILFLATAFLLAQDPPPAAPKKGGGGPPRNLKVLKPEEVRTTMAGMRGSLGVQCTFCHIPGGQDNASDENPHKLVARTMMKMMKEANATLGDSVQTKVTCYTCHRGKEKPESAPPPAQ